MTIKYANRTCDKCGARKPQPDMIRKEVYVETGKSKTTVTNDTYWGMAGGDKAAARAAKRALYNSGERTYTRKKTVWSCKNCRAPDSNYVPPVRKKLVVNTNVHTVGGADAPISNTSTQSKSILQKIVDRRPRTIFGWIILLYAVAVVLAMIDGG